MRIPALRPLKLLAPILLLGLLTACIDDTPYSSNYSHIVVSPQGPGQLVMKTARTGESVCREHSGDSACAYTVYLLDDEVVAITAVPDEGHVFAGWVRAGSPLWSDDLENNSNPLFLLANGDYFFHAEFR